MIPGFPHQKKYKKTKFRRFLEASEVSTISKGSRWHRWPKGRSVAGLRQLGLGSILAVMNQTRHLIVTTRDEKRRRMVAAGQVAIWNTRGVRVAVLVPSWKEGQIIRKLLVEQFGERRIGGSPRWQPLEELMECDVLVLTYERFVNYLHFQSRCGFYRLVLHNMHQLIRSRRMLVLETLLERVARLQSGFRICCTASGLPSEWIEWFQRQFPETKIARRGTIHNLTPNQILMIDRGDLSVEDVVPESSESCCLVVPRKMRKEVVELMAQEGSRVTVLGYGDVVKDRFSWVGVDLCHGWPTPEETELSLRHLATNGKLAILYDGNQEGASEDIVYQNFFAPLNERGFIGWSGTLKSTGASIAGQHPVIGLVLQLLRKIRYVRELGDIFRSLFLFSQNEEEFVQECEAAVARLQELDLVDHPLYPSSGREIRAGWMRLTKEGRRLASDFAALEVPKALARIQSLTELVEILPEVYEWISPENLEMLLYWSSGGKPPPTLQPTRNPELYQYLGRVYRLMRFITKSVGIAPLPEWEQIHKWPIHVKHRTKPRVSDIQALKRLTKRLYFHVIKVDVKSQGLDVEPWQVIDPRELAQLEDLELGQVKRLLFGFFEKHTTTRRKTLEYWVKKQWLREETLEKVIAIASRLVRGYWRRGVGRPRTVLMRHQEGA